jgi:predicted DNA repair protein MutK
VSGGLFALLDDVAALVKLTASSLDDVAGAAGRASAKAAGVVVDDTAVTPRYVEGIDPRRELPIIRRIATGSIRNKLLFILPAILLLSQFLPWLLTPLLMLGGAYLCFEGAEKVWEKVAHHGPEAGEGHGAAAEEGPKDEKSVIAGAVRTDFILSAEIMVIALDEVAEEPLLSRAVILVVVALGITVLVYGVVALIVKMDDVGLHLARRESPGAQRFGRLLVAAMPRILAALSTIGVVAMLWVGGHILLNGVHELGWHWPFDVVHSVEEGVSGAVPGIGGVLGWVAGTTVSALVGLAVGAVIVAVMHVVPRRTRAAAAH